MSSKNKETTEGTFRDVSQMIGGPCSVNINQGLETEFLMKIALNGCIRNCDFENARSNRMRIECRSNADGMRIECDKLKRKWPLDTANDGSGCFTRCSSLSLAGGAWHVCGLAGNY